MAINCFADGVDQGVGSVNFRGHWTNAATGPGLPYVWFRWGYAAFSFQTPFAFKDGQGSGSHSAGESVDKDRSAKMRFVGYDGVVEDESTSINFKTFADDPVFTGLFPGTPTTTECSVSGSVNPNTRESGAVVNIQYRKQGTVTWFETATVATLAAGAGTTSLGGLVTGLTPATAYEARYKITRDTANSTVGFSGIGTFTTQGATPVIVGAPRMLVEVVLFAPTTIAAGLTINPPIMEVSISMFAPTVIISSLRVLDVTMTLPVGIELTAVIG